MFLVLSVTGFLVLTAVAIHFEVLVFLSFMISRHRSRARLYVALSVLGALFAHLIEMVLFSFAYYLLDKATHDNYFAGNKPDDLSDYFYYSFVVYTSLGFGDITPEGDLRWITAIETLTGLVLIAWTASFLFLQMQLHWVDLTSQPSLLSREIFDDPIERAKQKKQEE